MCSVSDEVLPLPEGRKLAFALLFLSGIWLIPGTNDAEGVGIIKVAMDLGGDA